MNTLKIVIFCLFSLFLVGCESFYSKQGYEKKEKAESRIAELKREKQIELEVKTQEVFKAKDEHLKQVEVNFLETAKNIYGAYLAIDMKSVLDRLDTVIKYKLKTALLYAPAITTEIALEQNKLLKEELDETKISNEDLKKRYQIKEIEAIAAKKAEEETAEKIVKIEKEKQILEKKYNEEIIFLQDKLNALNTLIIQSEQNKASDQARKEKLQKLQIYILTGLGLTCGVLAAILKVRVLELGLGAAGFIALAIAVPFIEQWMVVGGLSAVFLIILAIIYFKYFSEKELADNSIGSIQEIRNQSEEHYKKKMKPVLNSWFEGKASLHKKVEKKLKDLNLK